MNPVVQTLLLMIDCLTELNIDYAVMGGLAVRVHAIPRPTNDVDLTVALSRDRLQGWFVELEKRGLSVPETYRYGWVDMVAGMPIIKLKTYLDPTQSVDIDVFLAESEYQSSILSRKIRAEVDGKPIWLVSAEDLILLKLIASRPRDLLDIADILFIQGEMDEAYMRKWAVLLGVESQLEQVLVAP
jgi:hypothetical protein